MCGADWPLPGINDDASFLRPLFMRLGNRPSLSAIGHRPQLW